MKKKDQKNKGGAIPKLKAEYFSMQGVPTFEQAELIVHFGIAGSAFFTNVHQQMCTEDYFVWEFGNELRMKAFLRTFHFGKNQFDEILRFAVEELEMFDAELYQQGYLFSESFLQAFERSLFKNRTTKSEDILSYAGKLKRTVTKPDQSKPDHTVLYYTKGNPVIPSSTAVQPSLTDGNSGADTECPPFDTEQETEPFSPEPNLNDVPEWIKIAEQAPLPDEEFIEEPEQVPDYIEEVVLMSLSETGNDAVLNDVFQSQDNQFRAVPVDDEAIIFLEEQFPEQDPARFRQIVDTYIQHRTRTEQPPVRSPRKLAEWAYNFANGRNAFQEGRVMPVSEERNARQADRGLAIYQAMQFRDWFQRKENGGRRLPDEIYNQIVEWSRNGGTCNRLTDIVSGRVIDARSRDEQAIVNALNRLVNQRPRPVNDDIELPF